MVKYYIVTTTNLYCMKMLLRVSVVLLFLSLIVLFVAFKAGYMSSDKSQPTAHHDVNDTSSVESPVDTITMAEFQANEKAKHMAMSSKSMTLSSTVSYKFYTPVDTIFIDGVEYVVVYSEPILNGNLFEDTTEH